MVDIEDMSVESIKKHLTRLENHREPQSYIGGEGDQKWYGEMEEWEDITEKVCPKGFNWGHCNEHIRILKDKGVGYVAVVRYDKAEGWKR